MSEKRVLVTGSSRGIGRAIALRLAQNGWEVAVHYSEQAGDAESLVKELGTAAQGCYQCNLEDPENIEGFFSNVVADGPLQAVVNNAGIYVPIDFAKSSWTDVFSNYRRTFAVNYEAPLHLTHLATQHFVRHQGGRVVNVASRVGFKSEAGAAQYAASKAALINLTRSLAAEMGASNVRYFGIAPGWVETAMAREGIETRLEEILGGIPLGRMASPEDCAAAVEFLLSPGADYLSGTVIDINGASYFH